MRLAAPVTADEPSRDPQREEAAQLLAELHSLARNTRRRRDVRDRLAEMHLPLVRYLARRFTGRNAPFEDIVQVGSIGLLKAIDRFDPDRGLEFSTYATPTILGEIRRYFRDTGWLLHVPRRAQELQARLARARSELTQQLQRGPTVRELAEHVGVDMMQVVEAIDVARGYTGVPLDALTDAGSGSGSGEESRKDRLAENDVDLERVELREELRPALAELSARDREILVLRFVAGKTQTEIAEIIGVSQMQISRLITRSLGQLRERLTVGDDGGDRGRGDRDSGDRDGGDRDSGDRDSGDRGAAVAGAVIAARGATARTARCDMAVRHGYSREETDAERLDRNYGELLQELRVAQTGVQILFAFLLTIAFQQRFSTLSSVQRGLYVGTLICAAVAAALFIAPVAVHRVFFRRRLKDELVKFTGRTAVGGLVFLALAMLGSVLLIVDFVSGPVAAWIITAVLAALFAWVWYLLPARMRKAEQPDEASPDE